MGVLLADAATSLRRSSAIDRLRILDQLGDPTLTALSRLTAVVAGASAAAVHIVDDAYQHRIAAANVPLGQHPRADSMCRVVVDEGLAIVCEDAARDPRFAYSSFTQGDQPVRFYASLPLRTADQTIVGTLCAFDFASHALGDVQISGLEDLARQAITHVELTRLALDLQHAATRDSLTGALNRASIDDRLAHAMARSRRHSTMTIAIMVDVDDFKSFNDVFGHAVGDEVLIGIAHRLAGVARAEDSVGRLGGDEFVVIAEVEHQAGADALVERLREAITTPIRIAGREQTIPASAGVAIARDNDAPADVLERADLDLARQKVKRGRSHHTRRGRP